MKYSNEIIWIAILLATFWVIINNDIHIDGGGMKPNIAW